MRKEGKIESNGKKNTNWWILFREIYYILGLTYKLYGWDESMWKWI